ncbi:MAG: ABC transporter ATP-binding protein [Dehalococcoidales bacterium]|nr:ABC transporter ATP-binding protein [Dehalococcoidales bacterium]
MSLIETVDLCQRRGDRDILKNINIRIKRGEVFALIGPTGSGKTTLLRLLDLIDTPDRGQLYFDGTDVTESARLRLEARRRMAFVLQKPVVFNTTVYDNITYGLRWRGMSRSDIRIRVDRVLEMVGLTTDRKRNARTLSGGEVQMVAIARAIATEPEVLLLDEPTANLDPVSTARIENLIVSIIERHDTTIVMATHDLSQGQRLADRAGMLLDGEILQTGDWREVFNAPRSRKIADFVGVENILNGVIASNEDRVVTVDVGGNPVEALSDLPVGEEVSACIRAEEVTLALSRLSSSARNSFTGRITRVVATGPTARIEVDCGFTLAALVTRRSAEEMALEKGKSVYATFKATAVHIIRRESTGLEGGPTAGSSVE